jgi:hypothetical protein
MLRHLNLVIDNFREMAINNILYLSDTYILRTFRTQKGRSASFRELLRPIKLDSLSARYVSAILGEGAGNGPKPALSDQSFKTPVSCYWFVQRYQIPSNNAVER